MNFKLKDTKNKAKAYTKSVYLSQTLLDRINAIAQENGTSFNNVVVSMIEHCLEEPPDETNK